MERFQAVLFSKALKSTGMVGGLLTAVTAYILSVAAPLLPILR